MHVSKKSQAPAITEPKIIEVGDALTVRVLPSKDHQFLMDSTQVAKG